MTIHSTAITLFLVMDPLGNIPIFLSELKHVDPSKRPRIIFRECLIAFAVLSLFLFFGRDILYYLSVSESSLGIAGGIILFLISLKMIFPSGQRLAATAPTLEPLVVPLAIPLIAGPSTIATVMLLAAHTNHGMPRLFLSLTYAATLVTLILLAANPLSKLLGERGLLAVERLMGMVLTTVAVQLFLSGLDQHFGIG